MPFTTQQQNVFSAVASTGGNIVVEAVAGSGKTTTAVEAFNYLPAGSSAAFVAFNKSIATELGRRLAGRGTAATVHSIGFSSVRDRFGAVRVENWKYSNIASRMYGNDSRLYVNNSRSRFPVATDEGESVLELVELIRMTGCVRSFDSRGTCLPSERQAVESYCDHFGVLFSEENLQCAIKIIAKSLRGSVTTVDFLDMVWLPVHLGLNTQRFDLAVVDESQDQSPIMSQLCMKLSDRLVIIGDSYQSIYGFAGADPEAMNQFKQRLAKRNGVTECPLTCTFRCPKSHVALARGYVPHLEAAPNAEDGELYRAKADGWMDSVRPGDLVVCRTNAPLVSAVMKSLASGIPSRMTGRDFGAGLARLAAPLDLDPATVNHAHLQALIWSEAMDL